MLSFSLPSCSPKQGVIWERYEPQKLANAKTAKMPVVLDFSADWCVACHELDHDTYTDPEVIKALEPFKRLKVDVTDQRAHDAMELVDRFHIEGVPTVIFLNENGDEVTGTRVEGFIPANQFLALIRTSSVAQKEKEQTNQQANSSPAP